MEVVALLNQKGGVGKTSSALHLSGSLAINHKLRVLAVDADPQASLTQGWWGSAAVETYDPSRTIAAVLGGEMPAPATVIRSTGVAGLDIVPGSESAGRYNHCEPFARPRDDWETVREFLREVEADYDFAVIDCPPNLYGCSVAALAAADWMMVPVKPEDFGAQGIAAVMRSLGIIQSLGYPVRLLGYLLTMVQPRLAVHQVYEGTMRETYGDAVFRARFPLVPAFVECHARREVIQQYKPKGAATKVIKAVADEMMSRISAMRGISEGQGVAA